jgi:chemotaxis family two-component system sensor kinase Cph1
VELEAVLEKALHNLETALEESCGSVTHDPLPPIIADETQMVQLFQNLIANGLKFHGEKSPEIHISAMRNDDNWTFSFRDNGIGIEDQYKDKIFVIFQRLHTRKEYPGTGIGLAISKKIVERHGGRIWVESKPGDGSTFYFTVPEKDDRSERKEQAKNG